MKLRRHVGHPKSLGKRKGGRLDQPVTEDNWEKVVETEHVERVRRRGGKVPLEQLLGEVAEEGSEGAPQVASAVVVSVAGGICRAYDGETVREARVPPEIALRQKSSLAVGDRVALVATGAEWKIGRIAPRRSVLSRPDPLDPHLHRLIVANVDVVVHVVSVKAPPLRVRLIDRYLIAIQRGGATPVLCVNKIDMLGVQKRAQELALLEPYRALEPVVLCSSTTGEGIDELRDLVAGKTCALVGHSGVGKSSILNALDVNLELATGGLHRRGTGRHTTTSSTLFDLGGGTYVIDTPGIREFGLWNLDRATLREYFPEFEEPAESCRFTDCSHLHEPDCEVREGVEDGRISRARYEAYARLMADLEG